MTYLNDPKIVNNYPLLEFFGLELKPMLHLFSLGHQNVIKYGGVVLTKKSQPKDVAKNIHSYLESFPYENDDIHMLFRRRVLVEKVHLHQLKSIKQLKNKK